MPESPVKAFEKAKAVFTAKVSVTKRDARGNIIERTLNVGKVWKGEPGNSITLGQRFHGCDYGRFDEGKSYLVYGEAPWDKESKEEFYFTSCSRTKPLEQAQIETRYLDAASRGEDGKSIDAAMPKLLLEEKDPNTRAEAATLIGEMSYKRDPQAVVSDETINALAKAAKDTSPIARLAVTRTLGIYKMSGKPAVKESLLMLLQDDHRDVRAAAVGAFGMVTWRESRVYAALKAALERARKDPNPDKERQQSLLSAFARSLTQAATTEEEKDEAVDLLLELVDAIDNPYNKVGPIQHLGFQKARAKKAAPKFMQILTQTKSYHLKQYTLIALGDIGAEEAQPEIEPYLQDENCYVVVSTVQAIHKMNPDGFDTFFRYKGMPALQARFDKCTSEFTYGLQSIGKDASPMAPFLKQKHAAMEDGDWKKQSLERLLEMLEQPAK